jgi:hypothetical protein
MLLLLLLIGAAGAPSTASTRERKGARERKMSVSGFMIVYGPPREVEWVAEDA